MFFSLEKDLKQKKYEVMLVSITAKHDLSYLRLPDRVINNKKALNYLITKESIAQDLFRMTDGVISEVFIDVEQKQPINLFDLAKKVFKKTKVLAYKPNDITVEAADQLILNHFSNDVRGKKILIYGTGNISTKLAVRLAERQGQVFIYGRNKEKAIKIIEAINMVLPSYSEYPLKIFNPKTTYDALLSFVSAEKVIDSDIAKVLNNFSIAIDGGIGNFTKSFIAETRKRSIRMLRLDVRIGEPFIEASVLAHNQSFFYEVMGEKSIGNIQVVAGGIIGSEGAVIVDQIKRPTQIIGIANGIGGVKSETELTDDEKRSLATINRLVLQNMQASF